MFNTRLESPVFAILCLYDSYIDLHIPLRQLGKFHFDKYLQQCKEKMCVETDNKYLLILFMPF